MLKVHTVTRTNSCQLLDNFCRKHCLKSSNLCCSSHLHGKQFQRFLIRLLTSTCTFMFQNLSSHFVVGIRLIYHAPVRNTVKDTLFLATSPYYNPTTYTSCESLRNSLFSTTSHLTIIKKTSTNQVFDHKKYF